MKNDYIDFDSRFFEKTGEFDSRKGGKIPFESSYEHEAMWLFDGDFSVKTFEKNAVPFSYIDPTTGEEIVTTFDFLVEMTDGSEKVIDIIPLVDLQNEEIIARTDAGEMIAEEDDRKYEVWSEPQLYGPNPEYMRSLIQFRFGLIKS